MKIFIIDSKKIIVVNSKSKQWETVETQKQKGEQEQEEMSYIEFFPNRKKARCFLAPKTSVRSKFILLFFDSHHSIYISHPRSLQ